MWNDSPQPKGNFVLKKTIYSLIIVLALYQLVLADQKMHPNSSNIHDNQHQRNFPKLDACLEKAGGVQFDMQQCVQEEYDRQGKRLEAAYQNAFEDLSPEQGETLSASQAAWLVYREAYGRLLYDDLEGGSIARYNAVLWLVHVTAYRIAELERNAE